MTLVSHRKLTIETIEAIPVTVPIDAPILTAFGSLSVYTRCVLRIRTEDGYTGYGEVSGRVRPEAFQVFAPVLKGMSAFETSRITTRIKNWNYYAYQKPEPIMAAIEMACLDLQGKWAGIPLHDVLGGKVHERVPVASYAFFRHANENGDGQVRSPEEVVAFANDQVATYGFDTIKLKGGYFSPDEDRNALEALRDSLGPDIKLRLDPQGAWTPATAIRIGQDIDRLGLEYYEDPCWNAAGMARVRKSVNTPLATNMCVTSFEEFHGAVQLGAVDIVLSDLWYWGGLKATLAVDQLCFATGVDLGMHSGGELGIGWAAMIHTAAAMPHLKMAIDNMNLHLRDDIIVGGKLLPTDGHISPPDGPGLGIEIDDEKLEKYSALAKSGSADDRLLNPAVADTARPGWFPKMPAW
jgi:glucarate dehydratase